MDFIDVKNPKKKRRLQTTWLFSFNFASWAQYVNSLWSLFRWNIQGECFSIAHFVRNVPD